MKKTYTKPDIMFENFSLSTNIAAGCEQIANSGDGVCGFRFGTQIIFTQENTGCVKKVFSGSGAYNGICYHNPTEEKNLFAS